METHGTVQNVATNAPLLGELLEALKELPHVGEIRQKGYMVGIELVQDKASRARFDPNLRVGHAFCQALRGRGVIVRPIGDTIILMPAPAMPLELLRTLVGAVRDQILCMRTNEEPGRVV
jgi:adenosylmethionine-8-amino-7-oxononanoate aminotransferase